MWRIVDAGTTLVFAKAHIPPIVSAVLDSPMPTPEFFNLVKRSQVTSDTGDGIAYMGATLPGTDMLMPTGSTEGLLDTRPL